MRRSLGIQDRQLDARSPSNPSNQTYILLFLPCIGGSSRPQDALQYRGENALKPVAEFLAACLHASQAAPPYQPKAPPDGSWVAVAVTRLTALQLRTNLRHLAVSPPVASWGARSINSGCITLETHRARSIHHFRSLSSSPPAPPPPAMGRGDSGDCDTVPGGMQRSIHVERLHGSIHVEGSIHVDSTAGLQDVKSAALKQVNKGAVHEGLHTNGACVSHSTCDIGQNEVPASTRAIYSNGIAEEVRGALWRQALGTCAPQCALDFKRYVPRLQLLLHARRCCATRQAEAARSRAATTPPRTTLADAHLSGWVKIDTCLPGLDSPASHVLLSPSLQDTAASTIGFVAQDMSKTWAHPTAPQNGASSHHKLGYEAQSHHALPAQRTAGQEGLEQHETKETEETEATKETEKTEKKEKTEKTEGKRGKTIDGKAAFSMGVCTGQGMEEEEHFKGTGEEEHLNLHQTCFHLERTEEEREQEREEEQEEKHLHQICLDLERTFPGVILFQADGALYGELRQLLFAVACHRPRLGYVQVLCVSLLPRLGVSQSTCTVTYICIYIHTYIYMCVQMRVCACVCVSVSLLRRLCV